jgi:hypothetical protein
MMVQVAEASLCFPLQLERSVLMGIPAFLNFSHSCYDEKLSTFAVSTLAIVTNLFQMAT